MKAYKLVKKSGGLIIRDRATNTSVGELGGYGSTWNLNLFGQDFKLKSKLKALGVVRGMFAAQDAIKKAMRI